MILIMDNGLSYSDHGIYFIDCDGMDPDEVSRLWVLGRYRSYGDGPFEIGRAEAIEWRDKDAMGRPEALIDPPDDVPTDFDITTASDRAIVILAKAWNSDVRDWVAAEQLRREAR